MENKIDHMAFAKAAAAAFNKEQEIEDWQERALKAEAALAKAEAEIDRLRTQVIIRESR